MASLDVSDDTMEQTASFGTTVHLVSPKHSEPIKMKTTQTGITFQSTTSNTVVLGINYFDIVGIKCVKIFETGLDEFEYGGLSIICYPEAYSYFRGHYRSRSETLIKTSASEEESSYTDEKKILFKWKRELLKRYHSFLFSSLDYFDVDKSVEVVNLLKDRKMLVVLNPVSGKGVCMKIYKEEVLPIFEDAEIQLDVVVTEYRGHARDLAKHYDLTAIQGIVCMGGDGTVHEIINGLMSRADWRCAIKMPICPIPCGSGNALAKTVLKESGEEYSITNSVLTAVYGAYVPFDIAMAQSETETLYFFMSFSWGTIADSDIESEKFRFLGEFRFTLGGLKCCLLNKAYQGTLHYIPHREYQVQSMHEPIGLESFRDVEESLRKKPMMGVICPQQPLANESDGTEQIEMPNANLLEPFDHQLSNDWVKLESVFTIFHPTLTPYLTRSMKIAPDHVMGGGYISLVLGLGRTTRIGILTAIRSWEKETHAPDVDIVKAEAFRFVPQRREGVFTVDGEVYPVQSFQAQVLKQLGRIMCMRVKSTNCSKRTTANTLS